MPRPRRIPTDDEIRAALQRVAILIFRREFESAYDQARRELRAASADLSKLAKGGDRK